MRSPKTRRYFPLHLGQKSNTNKKKYFFLREAIKSLVYFIGLCPKSVTRIFNASFIPRERGQAARCTRYISVLLVHCV